MKSRDFPKKPLFYKNDNESAEKFIEEKIDFYESLSLEYQEDKIINSSHVILPGVGAFGNAMMQIEKYNLHNTVQNTTCI